MRALAFFLHDLLLPPPQGCVRACVRARDPFGSGAWPLLTKRRVEQCRVGREVRGRQRSSITFLTQTQDFILPVFFKALFSLSLSAAHQPRSALRAVAQPTSSHAPSTRTTLHDPQKASECTTATPSHTTLISQKGRGERVSLFSLCFFSPATLKHIRTHNTRKKRRRPRRRRCAARAPPQLCSQLATSLNSPLPPHKCPF